MADPFVTSVEVEHKGDKYVFAMPSLHEEIKIGVRMKAISRDLGDAGSLDQLDFSTQYTLRACSTFDTLLRQGPAWVFTDDNGKPKVDSGKFPPDKVGTVVEVYGEFTDKVASFRSGGNPTQPPAA